MLSLEQIKLLEQKVEKAISLIKALSDERDVLKTRIAEKDRRIAELEDLVVNFKDDQSKIESGIKSTLNLLNSLEDLAIPMDSNSETEVENHKPSLQQAAKQKKDDLAQILGKQSSQNQEQADIF